MYTKFFKDLRYKDVPIAGGKGSSLGEMMSAKMPVPPGFVVIAQTFDKFLEVTDLGVEIEAIMKKVNKNDINSVDRASNEIRGLINDAKFPEDIAKEIMNLFTLLRAKETAIRSSATAEDSSIASWAGELESYLNVRKKDILASVKKCWASLFTPRAIFYRFEKELHKTKVSVAVVIQKMIQSKVSGICFTVHPVTEDRNQMIIEAGFGLGEAIVGGMITPDTYIVKKFQAGSESLKILDKNISEQKFKIIRGENGTVESQIPKSEQEKEKLSDEKILELAEICQKIENHYGFPCDIEWAMENGKFYIVQSRPITTL